ncbi:MAG: nucleotidyltransferase family protein [Chloroflexi bacterium]|nr:nucleotidyltransferase family protein [Chloroflexota bacterium]
MQPQTKVQLLAVLRQHQPQLKQLGVRRYGVFGSFARGEQTARSDVDLLIEFEPGEKTFDHFMQLATLLEDLLGRRVDLLTPESLSPYIGPKILREVEYVPVTP